MPKPPKSPVEKPSSHPRRPGSLRRSSSEKSIPQISSSGKHGVKSAQATAPKTKEAMSDALSGAKVSSVELGSDRQVKGCEANIGESPASQTSMDERPLPRDQQSTAQYPGTQVRGLLSLGRGGDSPSNTAAEEVERLRAAMNAQLQLSQHRENLAKQLEGRSGRSDTATPTVTGKVRVSPIHEEIGSPSLEAAFASPMATGMETSSTESAKTVRDGVTPAAVPACTPSYPFPPMRTPSMQMNFSGHRPFTALSPTISSSNLAGGSFDAGGPYDRVMSGPITPASALTFQPSGTYQPRDEDPKFPSPNLYDMSLMLSAEPGLDPWWTTVCQLMKENYKAERVTLSIPADSTDLENVPWGQKATFNVNEEDELSLTYLPRGSSMVPSSVGTNETSNSESNKVGDGDSPPIPAPLLEPVRPGLFSRHSFTSYEDTKRDPVSTSEYSRATVTRPALITRSQSYLSTNRTNPPPRTGTLHHAELSLQLLKEHMAFEDEQPSTAWENSEVAAREVRGRVFPILQALDYEADPLIDSSGIIRVLERGKVILLTRDYPYIHQDQDEKSGGSKSSQRSMKSVRESPKDKSKKVKAPELGPRISSFLGGTNSRRSNRSARNLSSDKGKGTHVSSRSYYDDQPPPSLPVYEEYEQAPPSPWSQTPASSPAVRMETGENPFFASATVEEETFDPSEDHQDYSAAQVVEAIGIDRSWTVLHIPLTHPLLSKPVQSFRLDAAAMESKTAGRSRGEDRLPSYPDKGKPPVEAVETGKEKRTPIAILSILSPIIPYPSSLRHSLENLAPHLATSFSLCRHFSNLETEVAGLSRKRPQTAGFGAVALGAQTEHALLRSGLSYSPVEDYGPLQSTGGSITSPSDYSGISRSGNESSPGGTPGWDLSAVGLTPFDKRTSGGSPLYNSGDGYFSSKTRPGLPRVDTMGSSSSITGARRTSKESSPADTKSHHPQRSGDDRQVEFETDIEDFGKPKELVSLEEGMRDLSSQSENAVPSRRQGTRAVSSQSIQKPDRFHSQLHSYGADFGSTFQSLPTTSIPAAKVPTPKSHSLTGSIMGPTDMPPPSDRLKGLMLDSLPAHVFVALPQTGEIVWVNSRYLTYRGQSIAELYQDPWASIHPEEREEYLRSWAHAVKTGEQFSMQVRIRRFDGAYRWFYTRAVGSRDTRGVIVQWYGSHMDIHDQHIAEVKAARQEEIEASEAKHRLLANLIPQIIFAATEDEGVTFANEQWLSYTGQTFDDSLGLGFMDYVHPEDLAKCRIPIDRPPTPSQPRPKKPTEPSRTSSQSSSGGKSSAVSEAQTETTVKGVHQSLSRNNSSDTGSVYEMPTADLSELARSGVIKVTTDSNGRLSYTTEVRLRSKTNEYRWHLVRCVEVDNINLGSGDGSWFGACTDINDHKLLETKLKEAMDSKSRFLSNMSHEIRTPLIGISGMVNFLQDTVLNDEQLDYTNTIQSSATNLLDIINDILDLSKVDAGMMKLSHEWFHTRSLVEEVNELVSSMAITKRLELNYVVDVDVPEMVKGDKVRIRQVLLNVIGNAIKFTATGEVFSRCRVFRDLPEAVAENEIMLEYSIIDTGRGFTQEEADLIFKPFSQIDGSSTRQHGGSGLGLVISRQLVELHGGKMQGSAVPGEGSTFTFTAKFGLPTLDDYPEPLATPHLLPSRAPSTKSPTTSTISNEITPARQPSERSIMPGNMVQSPAANSESSADSPAVASSVSSIPSLKSGRSHVTGRSSMSSINPNLATFSEAARAIGSDPTQMKLALPERSASGTLEVSDGLMPPTTITMQSGPSGTTIDPGRPMSPGVFISPGETPVENISRQSTGSSSGLKRFRPPMYSILLICPQKHSREATTQHIEITLPKDVPHQIIPMSSVEEAQAMIGGDDPVVFTHIVLNLPLAEEIVSLIDRILLAVYLPLTSIVVLSDPVQRQEVIKLAASYDYEQLAKDNRVNFIYKPVKPSRFAVIFDPDNERDLSIDRNRSNAQQEVANQKQNYLDVEKRLGNKGLKVLLVEDNLVNQKVLLKFLSKVGIAVELALDGVECIEKVFSHPHSFYSLILCDLHMPRKDGYQTCQEIREWEEKESNPRMPIIALSANVMADVLDKCVAAGFNSYVTKPVDFKALSTAMGNLLDPIEPEAASKLVNDGH